MTEIVPNTNQPNAFSKILDFTQAILPDYLSYRTGRDPNTNQPTEFNNRGFLFSPDSNAAPVDSSPSIYGRFVVPGSGPLLVGGVVLLTGLLVFALFRK